MAEYDIKKLLGARIKMLRAHLGFTQEEFAERIGLSTRSVSFIETGKTYPAAETIGLICDALHIKPHRLFLFDPPRDIHEIKQELVRRILADDLYAALIYKLSAEI